LSPSPLWPLFWIEDVSRTPLSEFPVLDIAHMMNGDLEQSTGSCELAVREMMQQYERAIPPPEPQPVRKGRHIVTTPRSLLVEGLFLPPFAKGKGKVLPPSQCALPAGAIVDAFTAKIAVRELVERAAELL
jgi:hypothetical protein